MLSLALAGVALWIEGRPADQRVSSLIPGQHACLGGRLGPQLGVCERQLISVSQINVSFPLFLPPSLLL